MSSIAEQNYPVSDVIIVDQSPELRSSAVVERWSGVLPVRMVTCPPGLSRSRNAGIAALERCDVVAVTDDDCEFTTGAFLTAVGAIESGGLAGISGCLESDLGVRTKFSVSPLVLNADNVWRNAIEAALFLRVSVFFAVGGFDESLGLGSGTPWRSGEGTDLLLRMLRFDGGDLEYLPSVVIRERSHSSTTPRNAWKARSYGRGTGRVLRKNYIWSKAAPRLMGPLARGTGELLRGRFGASLVSFAEFLGRVEGWLGIAIKGHGMSHIGT